MLPRSVHLGYIYLMDSALLALFENPLPKPDGKQQQISMLSYLLGIVSRLEQMGVSTPDPTLLRILNSTGMSVDAGLLPGKSVFDGLLALDVANSRVRSALHHLSGCPPECELLQRAYTSLVEAYNCNTAAHCQKLMRDGLAVKAYSAERREALEAFTESFHSWQKEVAAACGITRGDVDFYTTTTGPLSTTTGHVQFPTCAPPSAGVSFAAESQRGPPLAPDMTTENLGNMDFSEAPAGQQEACQPVILEEVEQLMMVTGEILFEFAANLERYYSGQGVRSGKSRQGRKSGKTVHILWPYVQQQISQVTSADDTRVDEYVNRLLIFNYRFWESAVEAARVDGTSTAGIQFRVPSLKLLNKGSRSAGMLSNHPTPQFALEQFAMVILEVLLSKQWRHTSSAVMFSRSLSSEYVQRENQVELFMQSVQNWFLALFPPRSTELVLPVLSSGPKHLFANKKHFWKFNMIPKDK
jgi:hypothetical protein